MILKTDGIEQNVETIDAAVRRLIEKQPRGVEVNGIVIDRVEPWTDDAAIDEVAAAMSAGDWYWHRGSAYCPACVECDSPAIDRDDPLVQRGGTVTICSCCETDYGTPEERNDDE